MMLPPGAALPIDTAELVQMTAELRATSYHERLEDYVRQRIAYLLNAELTDPHAVMKCRGQVEELQHLLCPAFAHTLALLGLRKRAEAAAAAAGPAEPEETPPPRDWWADPTPTGSMLVP